MDVNQYLTRLKVYAASLTLQDKCAWAAIFVGVAFVVTGVFKSLLGGNS